MTQITAANNSKLSDNVCATLVRITEKKNYSKKNNEYFQVLKRSGHFDANCSNSARLTVSLPKLRSISSHLVASMTRYSLYWQNTHTQQTLTVNAAANHTKFNFNKGLQRIIKSKTTTK